MVLMQGPHDTLSKPQGQRVAWTALLTPVTALLRGEVGEAGGFSGPSPAVLHKHGDLSLTPRAHGKARGGGSPAVGRQRLEGPWPGPASQGVWVQ